MIAVINLSFVTGARVTSPVVDEHTGELLYIIHRAEDVYGIHSVDQSLSSEFAGSFTLADRFQKMEAEIYSSERKGSSSRPVNNSSRRTRTGSIA